MSRWTKTGQRLAVYGRPADADHWGRHWQDLDVARWVEWARSDRRLLPVLLGHLPPSGKILEAGCGLGQYVAILREKGYDVEGIDISREVVRQVREAIPDLPVKVGNVLELPCPDGHFDAIPSLGVVEHFEDGPEKALTEASRVLKKGGVLLATVPYYNWLRRLKGGLGLYRGNRRPGFYQYAFTVREFKHLLRASGFTVISLNPYNARKGLKDELPLFLGLSRFISGSAPVGKATETAAPPAGRPAISGPGRLFGALVESAVLRRLAGHMMLYVARKG